MEIVLTAAILAIASFVLYKNFKKSTKGQCNCSSCSAHCPLYEKKDK